MTDGIDTSRALAERLSTAYGLEPFLAERLVEEVLHAYGDTLEEWVRSTHIRLQRRGLRNEDIYLAIQEELPRRRFVSPQVSVRQIRRMIYG